MLGPPMSIEDSTIVDCRVRDLAVLATYSDKPNTSAIPLCEKTTVHWVWEMAGVACTHPARKPSETEQGGGVLCS